ncbi:importin subunit alpha-1-like isoform X2 [Hyposmocoma kahamanoa]|uniref:importin subunit alpha-1-like isoform X2 n=1 Tax=Hyposmocoma kahamanoa TaxID=1477025 RepID=UPI000E6D6414|nr:importin subunit alpha-1-like isoform X2 [Hyposmocoma kahamanoa]
MVTTTAYERKVYEDFIWCFTKCLLEQGFQNSEEIAEVVPQLVEGLNSDDLATKTSSARAARRMLSREQNPPITLMVEAGVIKPLVEALERDDCPDLQFEAAWAITNIASGTHEHTMAVVENGAIPKLVNLLSRGGVVGEQSAWALGNIAGDGPTPRDYVLAAGALPALLPLLNTTTVASQLRTAVWTYSNFCRNKSPMVKFELVSAALPYIADLLETEDQDVLADACWALSYLTDGPNERIEGVQTTPALLPRLVRLLRHPAPAVRTPALRAIGNMLTGSDHQTDRCLQADCLPALCTLLRCGKSSLMKEAAWAVSNVLAGTTEQIQQALDAGVLEHLLHVLSTEDIKCQKEAAWAITNLCLGGTPEQLDALLQAGFLEPYCMLLSSPDQRAIIVVLDGLTNLLQAAAKFGQVEPLCIKLEEIGALDRIEALQTHENEQIYKKALSILDNYFCDQEDGNAQPEQTEEEYQFGTAQPQNINF